MADETTVQRLRGLVLSATELKAMTNWPDALVEDYLNLIDNFITLAGEIDTKNNILKNTEVVTSSPYQIEATDEEVYYNTDAGDIIALLPEGVDGTNYRHISTGSNGFKVILTPFGTEELFGENEVEYIYDVEVLITTFETTEGWY